MHWLLVLLLVFLFSLPPPEPPARPNILLITIETLRRDHCSP